MSSDRMDEALAGVLRRYRADFPAPNPVQLEELVTDSLAVFIRRNTRKGEYGERIWLDPQPWKEGCDS